MPNLDDENLSTSANKIYAAALAAEQNYLDFCYQNLDRTRELYLAQLAQVQKENNSSIPQHRSERNAFAHHYAAAAARLSQVEDKLIFGRLDLTDGTTNYIGRIGLSDENRRQILLDWRTPSARLFYQATAKHPENIRRRRHISTSLRKVIALDDELLSQGDENGDDKLEFTGEGALMKALGSARTGKMGDIVATIQSEQDQIIRSSSKGVLVVQGGPGTGKTAVALHRAAYLLYEERERLENSGVLVVGPSPIFLSYISNVLPSLGENNVVSVTLDQLLPNVKITKTDSSEVSEIKGRLVWKKILPRLVRTLERSPKESIFVPILGVNVELTPKMFSEARAKARQSTQIHNSGWNVYAKYMLGQAASAYAEAKKTSTDEEWVYEDLRQCPAMRRAINWHWLPYSAVHLLLKLWSKPRLLKQVAPELTDKECQALLSAKPGISRADIALIDELEELIGPVQALRVQASEDQATLRSYQNCGLGAADLDRQAKNQLAAIIEASYRQSDKQLLAATGGDFVLDSATSAVKDFGLDGMVSAQMVASEFAEQSGETTLSARAAADRSWAFGHVVVDEAQELSQMDWRMLSRRCPTRSFTVVGDLDQRPSGAPSGGWSQALQVLGDSFKQAELTVSYRTPKTILRKAEAVLSRAGYPLQTPLVAARDLENCYQTEKFTSSSAADQEDQLKAEIQNELKQLEKMYGTGRGNLAVILSAADKKSLSDSFNSWLQETTSQLAESSNFLTQRLSVITPLAGKGLEFDIVIVCHPRRILDGGIGDLYVALTRPTQKLVVMHEGELPAGL